MSMEKHQPKGRFMGRGGFSPLASSRNHTNKIYMHQSQQWKFIFDSLNKSQENKYFMTVYLEIKDLGYWDIYKRRAGYDLVENRLLKIWMKDWYLKTSQKALIKDICTYRDISAHSFPLTPLTKLISFKLKNQQINKK